MRTAALVIAAVALLGTEALGYCPSYTASSPNNDHSCATEAVPGTNPTVAQWQAIFNLVGQGPSVWGSAGPSVADITQGCGKPQTARKVPAKFPCEILKAIAMQESSWKQFCVPDSPSDQVGGASRTIISFDCGYGIGQVTSGMRTFDGTPGFDRYKVAADATYNLATGTRILASKWGYTACVGDRQPTVVEHWYSSVWAYNGLAYINSPANPTYSSNRGVWNPSVGGKAPYQEKVFGRVEYPPSTSYWAKVALAYPSLAEVGGGNSPPALPEPSCASPTNCTSKRSAHLSYCFGGTPDAGTPDAGRPDAGRDAGAPAVDAGPRDGGSQEAGPDGGPRLLRMNAMGDELGQALGCGCGAGTGAAGGLLWLSLSGLALLARRPRRELR